MDVVTAVMLLLLCAKKFNTILNVKGIVKINHMISCGFTFKGFSNCLARFSLFASSRLLAEEVDFRFYGL